MYSNTDNGPIEVFLVDDHKCILWGLEKLVTGEHPRMRVAGKASSRADALLGIIQTAPNVVVLDLDLGSDNSLEFLPELLQKTSARILILTGARDQSMLDRAITLGASGIVLKDEPAEVLIRAIECVNRGELWLDHSIMARVLGALTRDKQQDSSSKKTERLTPKEHQIVCAVVEQRGAKSGVIAGDLYMSEHTLRNHLTTIYRKLDVKNRLELVMFALESELTRNIPTPSASRRQALH